MVLIVFYFLKRTSCRKPELIFLVLASFLFYMVATPWYVLLLGASLACNYWLKLRIQSSKWHGKTWLVAGIVVNVLVLAVFKYLDFFIGNLNHVLDAAIPAPQIVLPLGISFLTFQQIAFLVDTYRGTADWVGVGEYALTTTFFPKLLAGPIVRHADFAPQLARLTRGLPWEQIAQGSTLFAIGLFKKTALADSIAPWSDAVFNAAAAGDDLTAWAAWAGTLAYTLQLYFDFSAYSDMALGIAHMFGLQLPINFDSPYKSRSVSEFWRRWHISLGAFLRDYLYIPLGGNRRGTARMIVNLVVTMLIAGLWHGAGWGFVLWGGLHGIYLAGNALLRRIELPRRLLDSGPGQLGSWALTFLLVAIAWVPFRATSLGTAGRMYTAMVDLGTLFDVSTISSRQAMILLGLLGLTLVAPNPVRWVRQELPRFSWQPTAATVTAAVVFFVAGAIMAGRTPTFIYFGF